MADVVAGQSVHVPARATFPQAPSKVVGVPFIGHYLDGAPIEEVDAIRVVGDSEVGPQSASVATDFLDTTDTPAASGVRHKSLATTGTTALVGGDAHGLIQLTTGAVAGNSQSFNRFPGQSPVTGPATAGPPVTLAKRMWYTCNITIPTGDSVADGSILVGLASDNWAGSIGTLPTDGLFFRKADTASDFTFEARKNATSTTLSGILATAGVTLTLNVALELSFRIDTDGAVKVFVNGIFVGSVANNDANIPYTPSSGNLTPSFMRAAGAGAVARKLNIDYYLCGEEVS
jgi:hypothetical protein